MKKWSADFRFGIWDLGFGIGELTPVLSLRRNESGEPGTKLLDCDARADCREIKVIDLKGIPSDFAVDLFTALIGSTGFAVSSGTE
jgi:hypothetical protein